LAFTRLFVDATNSEIERNKTNISRQSRTVIWLGASEILAYGTAVKLS